MGSRPRPSAFSPTAVLLVGLVRDRRTCDRRFAVQIWAQQLVPAQQVALFFASEPAYAAWLSWYFLGETLDLHGWIGSGLILVAVTHRSLSSARPHPMAIATGRYRRRSAMAQKFGNGRWVHEGFSG